VPSRRVFGPYLRARLRLDGGFRTLPEAFGDRLGDRVLLPTPTGRHALWRFLQSFDWQPGDEVLVGAWNFWVVVGLLVQAGLKPIFVDVDPETLCMDPADARSKRTDRTRLVLLTHMFGNPAPARELRQLCDAHELLLFEDCAHAVGTMVHGAEGLQPAGTFGHGALFSFGMFKSVNALGGGMLAVEPGLAARVLPLPAARGRVREQDTRAVLSVLLQPPLWTTVLRPALERVAALRAALDAKPPPDRFVFDPTERAPYQPFMGECVARQLEVEDAEVARRRELAEAVAAAVAGRTDARALVPDRHGRANLSYLGLWVDRTEDWLARFDAAGVEAKALQFRNCAELPLFADHGADCPGARELDRHLLRLPSFPHMRADQLAALLAVLRARARP
jgi:dTDP-4-amino-4,6-dideoxygalactose transaminase